MIESTNGCFLKRFHHDGPILVTEGGGKREREGHRSCWVDSEVRSHSFIFPCSSDKTTRERRATLVFIVEGELEHPATQRNKYEQFVTILLEPDYTAPFLTGR